MCLLQRLGPIDRTPGIPGSDKNCDRLGQNPKFHWEKKLKAPPNIVGKVWVTCTIKVRLILVEDFVVYDRPQIQIETQTENLFGRQPPHCSF